MREPSIRRLQQTITSREFAAWNAFFEHEPQGEERMDVRFALLCRLVANAHFKAEGGGFRLEDFFARRFLPLYEERLEEELRGARGRAQSAAAQRERLARQIRAQFAGRTIVKGV